MALSDTDFIFPPRVIPDLRDVRGLEWQEFIDRISTQKTDSPERVALVLLMVRLCGCTTCQADSFKAMRGCIMCATQTIKRYKNNDKEILDQVNTAVREVNAYTEKRIDKKISFSD